VSTVWYFAYGSNMHSGTLRGRRGVEYMRAVAGRLSGWRLVLDKPPLFGVGGAFANIVPQHGAHVLGVLFEVTADDYSHIELTEGVLLHNYERVAVNVRPLRARNAGDVPAFTLASDRRDPSLLPTRRYVDLLIAGAQEHDLPARYVAALRRWPTGEETPEERALRPLIDQLLRRQ
jgi:hypothetical protein